MKVLSVRANNRKKCFEVRTRQGSYTFPYSATDTPPTARDRVVRLFVDPELARDGFTYELASGAEDSVLMDWVLSYNRDPGVLTELMAHELTCLADDKRKASGLSTREICRRLGTSASQLYRLLDTRNPRKPFEQLIRLLIVLGCEIRFDVKDVDKRRRA
jgi:hypothetical protein